MVAGLAARLAWSWGGKQALGTVLVGREVRAFTQLAAWNAGVIRRGVGDAASRAAWLVGLGAHVMTVADVATTLASLDGTTIGAATH